MGIKVPLISPHYHINDTTRAHAQVEKDAATETFSTWGGEVVAEAAFRIREAQSAFDPKSAIN